MQLGEKLRALRKEKNLSIKKVAEFAKISPRSLSCIEAGKQNPHFVTVEAILKSLNCSLAELETVEPDHKFA